MCHFVYQQILQDLPLNYPATFYLLNANSPIQTTVISHRHVLVASSLVSPPPSLSHIYFQHSCQRQSLKNINQIRSLFCHNPPLLPFPTADNKVAATFDSISSLSPLLSQLQPQWPMCYNSNLLHTTLPQYLCNCHFLGPEFYFSRKPHASFAYIKSSFSKVTFSRRLSLAIPSKLSTIFTELSVPLPSLLLAFIINRKTFLLFCSPSVRLVECKL